MFQKPTSEVGFWGELLKGGHRSSAMREGKIPKAPKNPSAAEAKEATAADADAVALCLAFAPRPPPLEILGVLGYSEDTRLSR